MTDPMMSLQSLLEKSSDADLLRGMIGFAAQRLMELEVEGLTGAGRRGPHAGSSQPPQRLPRPPLGDPRRHRRSEDPEAAQGLVLSGLPRAAKAGRKSAHRRHPGGLHPWRLDALGRRPGAGLGHDRHLEEPGLAPVCRDRREGSELLEPPTGGRLAVPLAGCHLRQGARSRPHRLQSGDRRRRRQHRRPPRGAGPSHRPVRDRGLLDGLPAGPYAARLARGQAGDLGRP